MRAGARGAGEACPSAASAASVVSSGEKGRQRGAGLRGGVLSMRKGCETRGEKLVVNQAQRRARAAIMLIRSRGGPCGSVVAGRRRHAANETRAAAARALQENTESTASTKAWPGRSSSSASMSTREWRIIIIIMATNVPKQAAGNQLE